MKKKLTRKTKRLQPLKEIHLETLPELLSADGFGEQVSGHWQVDIDFCTPNTAQIAKDTFRQAIAKYYPEVLFWLSQKVLPVYSKACGTIQYQKNGLPIITYGQGY